MLGGDSSSTRSTSQWFVRMAKTALHWAAKRNHTSAVSYLLSHGADKAIRNKDGDIPALLTTSSDVKALLGDFDTSAEVRVSKQLPITPNYLAHPAFPYFESQFRTHNSLMATTTVLNKNELVLKARIANVEERDFIEIELECTSLKFDALLTLMCRELGVDKQLVHKIRKLPDTIIRKDKDVQRLLNFHELELVLTNKAVSSSSRNYGIGGGLKQEQILY